MKRKSYYPKGWNEAKVRKVLDHYENQTEEQAAAEDDARIRANPETVMTVPPELVPQVRQLIAAHLRKGRSRPRKMKGAA